MKRFHAYLSALILCLLISSPSYSQTVVSLPSSDLAYDAGTERIYASVPSTDTSGRANTVTPINPASGALGTSISVGLNPKSLAVSDDGQFLYAGLLGASTISRITLATQTVGLQISVPSTVYGTMSAGEIKVLPGNARAIAITRGSYAGVAIFDDNVQRAMSIDSVYVASSIAFASSSSSTLYGYDNYSSGFEFVRFNVNSSGLTQIDQTAGLISGFGVRIFGDGGLIYASNGVVVNPQTKTVAGTFAASGSVCPEVARNRVYFLTQSSGTVTLKAFNATTYALVSSLAINGVSGTAGNLIRCGASRLAFRTTGNQVYIVNNATLVPPALSLAMPASTVEGAGVLPAAGTVSITEAQATNVVVSLASSDTSKITVPVSATILAGQLSATFAITVANNSLLEGPRNAVISATASGIVSASGSIRVNDDEQAVLTVSLPASATQGTSSQGTVTFSVPPVIDMAVTLSSNSGLLAVPTTVTILAGQTSGTFNFSTLESEQDVGPQTAMVTAHVDGWSDASASIAILDLPRTENWPTYGNNVGHTGFQATTLGNTPYEAGWSVSYPVTNGGLNQVAVGNGTVFVTPWTYFGDTYLSALDASTGTELWRRQFASSYSINPPTFDLGRVYVQRGNHSSDSQFWCLDAATGNTVWSSPFSAQWERYAAPTVLNGGAWVDGGSYGGLYGFNTNDGSQRFFNSALGQIDGWTPTYYNGTLYTSVGQVFRAHDPITGVVLWNLNLPSAIGNAVSAISQNTAYVVGETSFYSINLTAHSILWSASGSFKGNAAVAGGVAYVLSGSNVLAYNAVTGALVGTYPTGSTSISGQPIVTSDSLIVTSSTSTYVFNLQTFALKQTLPSGGTASLASGILFLAGGDGVLRTFYPGGMNTIAIGVPASAREGDAPLTGTVALARAQLTDTVISLTSSNPTRIGVPASVTIPANQTSATFQLTVVDDALLNGPENVTITARGPGFALRTGSSVMAILDNEAVTLALNAPSSAAEGTYFPVTLSMSGPAAGNIAVRVTSSDNSELFSPATVVIPAGQTSVVFNVQAVEDGFIDGNQTATLTAQVQGWTDGTATISVLDSARNVTGDWSTFGNGPAHTGYQPITVGGVAYQAGWSVSHPTSTSGLNQVAVGNGRVYVTPYVYFGDTYLGALDASSGTELWRRQFASAYSINPPTFDLGKVYVQRGSSGDSRLWCLDAATGNINWSAPFGAQWERYGAPAVFNGGVWVAGGSYGGLYGFNTSDGSERFFNASLGQVDQWAPAYYNGTVYTWVAGVFRAHDPVSGTILWSLSASSGRPSSANSAPAIDQGRAFVVGHPNFCAIDLTTQTVAWSPGGSFKGSPAVANGAVYALSGSNVKAYDTQTGTLLGTYATGDANLDGQPLITNDTLFVTSSTQTYVFNLANFALLQTLPVGGPASLANGILYLAGPDGVLRTYSPVGRARADLAIAQTLTPNPAGNGDTVTITLTASNSGPDTATAVVIRDLLPAGLDYVSGSASQGTCLQAAGTVTCALGDLASGASATVTITATSNGTGNMTNPGIVTSSTYETNAGNNSSSVLLNIAAPAVTTLAPTFAYGTTTLHGTVNARGVSTAVSFDLGTSASYGSISTGTPSPVTGYAETEVSGSVYLTPGTTYHCRVRGVSSSGTSTGNDVVFTTPNNNASLSNLTLSTGTLSPVFSSNTRDYTATVAYDTGSITMRSFVTDPNATVTVAGIAVVSGSPSAPINLSVGGNYITVVVTAQDGYTSRYYSINVTRPAPPPVITAAAGSVSPSAATLNGTVNAQGVATTVQFQYGLTTAYGSTAPVTLSPNNSTGPQTASVVLSGLASGITYHYRLVATSSLGTFYGQDQTFTTGAPGILVEQPVGFGLVNGSAALDLGANFIGVTGGALTFTVRNTGPGTLSGLALSVDGATPQEYTVSGGGLPASLEAGGSGTFTVVFQPLQTGPRAATLRIASNDALQNPFSVALTGTGVAQPGPGQTIQTAGLPAVVRAASPPFPIFAGATSGLPVTYAVLAGPATVSSSGLVTLTGSGAVTVKISQAGGGGYDPAESYVTFQVTAAGQDFVKLARGSSATFSAGIRADGTLWTWGRNALGQLGDGTTTDRYSPVQVGSATDWMTLSCGQNHTLAIKSDGTLWAWGYNFSNQVGDGTGTTRTSPVQIGAGSTWTSVSGGLYHSVGVKSDGSLWTWGWNGYGQLGDGTFTQRATPVRTGTATDWAKVACGGNHTLGIKNNGTLWIWGYNSGGQVGDGSYTNRSAPVQIGSDTTWVSVAGGEFHTVATKADGTLWTWGSNDQGQLGDGTNNGRNSPARVGSANNWTAAVSAFNHTLAVKSDGTLWAWGHNSNGQVGDGTVMNRNTPVQIGSTANWATVGSGYWHTIAVQTDGSLWTWGSNDSGRLGYVSSTLTPSPVSLGTASSTKASARGSTHAASVRSDGTLWAWGYNIYGQVGDGTTGTNRITPVQIGNAGNWDKVACGDSHTAALKSDGTLWAWGYNADGQLGDGTTTSRTTPVQIGTATNWAVVACGAAYTVAVKNDGTLWAWGTNFYGQLGDGTVTSRTTPVQIGTATNWSAVVCGADHTVAVKNDGTLWAWGTNGHGQLGDGTTDQWRTFPVQIGTDANWAAAGCGIFHTMAVKSDGTLWAWGSNAYGQLGDGTTSNRTSPAQIGGSWAAVGCGTFHTMAVKSDGTLWAWGNNAVGQLGDGTTASRTTPARIGSSSAWGKLPLGLGSGFSGALTLDGTLWTCGENTYGQLGTGSTSNPRRIVPARAAQTLSFPTLPPLAVGQSYTLAALAGSRLPVSYGVSGPATLNGNVLTVTGFGPVRVMAWQPGDGTWSYPDPLAQSQTLELPAVTTITAINVSSTTATLRGMVNPKGRAATARFEYGITTSYGSFANVTLSPNDGTTDQAVSAALTGLTTGQTYHYRITATNSLGTNNGADQTFTPAPPQITVEQPAGSGLASGAIVLFGSSNIGATGNTLTFTVRNTGTGTLSGLGVSVNGVAQADYTVSASSLPASLETGGSATFAVTFRPWQGGARLATIHIASNDPLQNPFDVNLSGTGNILAGPGQTIVAASVPAFVKTGSAPFPLRAGATSSLPLTYAVAAGPATISGAGLLTLTGSAGAVTVRISQAGNGSYNPAEAYVTFHATVSGQEFVKMAKGALATHSAGLRADGTLWTWGYNGNGQLGDGTTTSRGVPAQVGTATWVALACGNAHTMAVKSDGTLWGWGYNNAGQLGDGSTTQRNTPVQIGTATNWRSVECGYAHTLAIKTDGTLWAWGWNGYGEVGDGTTINRSVPTPIGTATNWVAVAGGDDHSMGVRSDGTLWGWGLNNYGQLADGTTTQRLAPVPSGTLTNWTAVTCGFGHSAGVQSGGTIWAWGNNSYGQIGDGTTSTRSSPYQVGAGSTWAAVIAGRNHTAAVRTDGALWTWGDNGSAQLGDGTLTQPNGPVQIGTTTTWSAVNCGYQHTMALAGDGTLWSWGSVPNSSGERGDGGDSQRLAPALAGAGTASSAASGSFHNVVIKGDGTLWAWGYNGYGQLGDGTYNLGHTPAQIGASTSWARVACGLNHTTAIKSDGTLWGWGLNSSYQVGDGTTSTRQAPVQIGTATNWAKVACGSNYGIALQTDGTLWGWGLNTNGQLGNGTTTQAFSPVQIGTATDWSAIACGATHTMALKSDGSLWAWGNNGNGRLGNGTSTQSTIPIQITSAVAWAAVACGSTHTVAIKIDGTLWAWGANTLNQLGDGTVTQRISPVQIGTATNWSAVASGQDHTLALRSDGTLWGWGANESGQLGDGSSTQRSAPVAVGSGNGWSHLPAQLGARNSAALTPDGTVWTSGNSNYGVLGTLDCRIPNRIWPNRAPQTFTFPTPPPLTVGVPVTLAAFGGSQLPVNYRVSGPATLSGNVITRTAAGSLQIVAWQPGDAVWGSSEPQTVASPTVTTGAATGLDASIATLGGTVNPRGQATTAQFEYGQTTGYGSTASVTLSPNNGTSPQAISASLTGLMSGTTYHYRLAATSSLGTSYGVDRIFTTLGAFIVVEQPAGTPLGNEVSTRDFGSANIGAAGGTLAFTVGNTGSGTLGGLALSVTGAGAADFTINAASLPTTLAPGASTSFSVSFRPWQGGARAAVLRITSNDAPRNPFNVNLTGTGLTQPGPAQSITAAPPTLVRTGSAPFYLRAGATSGLPLTFALQAGPATIGSDGLVTLTGGPGAVTARLTQPGNASYHPTESIVTFAVTPAGQEFVKVARGSAANHELGLRADGTLWAWGANASGQLGDGTTTARATAAPVGTATNWIAAAVGTAHSVALKADGTLWAWGLNTSGQLGDGSKTARPTPVPVGTATNWAAIACGANFTLALKTDGTLWAWGQNSSSQLGDGLIEDRSLPFQIGTATNWAGLSAGTGHTVAVKTDGTLWSWGTNANGQLGDGTTTARTAPAQTGTLTTWATVACGSSHTAALRKDGTLWAWGSNASGQLGDGSTTQRLAPVPIGAATKWAALTAGANHTAAFQSDGTLWAWGLNSSGQLGDGTTATRTAPVPIGTATTWAILAGGASHTLALQSDGALWTWGSNASGQSGDGPTNQRFRPVPATGAWASAAAGTSSIVTIKTDGTLWTWGSNASSQLGDGTTTSRSTPVQIGTATDWASTARGSNHSVALKTNGTLWSWGNNAGGQLGDGTTTARTVPAQTGTATDWASLACGTSYTLGIKTDGTLWAWGINGRGQLGDGTTTQRNLPVAIASAVPWTRVVCGASHTLALKTDGTLWAWGNNTNGQLGDGTITQRNLPVLIASAVPWATVACGASHTLALKTDGTLWAWGLNTSGQLGDGTITQRLSPVQIGTATDWASATAGSTHSIALKTDGTLWAWGLNTSGQLGDGTATQRLSPVQIGLGTAWGKLPARTGDLFTPVLARDGTLWTCGDRSSGVLGHLDPTVPNRAWPTRATQTLSLPTLPALSVAVPVILAATSDSQLPISYRVVGPATLSGNLLTPTAAGLVQLIAWQPGDTVWATTEPLRQSQTVTLSTNANLASLTLSAGTLTPAFTPATTGYTATVSYSTAAITVTPTLADLTATGRVNGTLVDSGGASQVLTLAVGANPISIEVTAQDGVARMTYTVTVTRQSAIESWRQFYFGNATAFTGDLEDFDRDGVLNLFEFAFGTDPTVQGSGVLQYNGTFAGGGAIGATGQPTTAFEPTATGIDYRALFVRRKDHVAAGLTYTPQFSADLLTWVPGVIVPTVLADDGTHQIVSVPYPPFVSGKKARFFRIQFAPAP